MRRRGQTTEPTRARPLRIAGPCVVLLLCVAAPLADTGYRYDYDFPDLGDDWYGHSDGPDPQRDYPAFETDRFSAGDDFGYGYDPAVDLLGLGPPLELTQRRHTEYHFRFFTLVGCLEALDCADDRFCNGEEVCSSDGCGPGSPACDDEEPCTVDTCEEAARQCTNLWVPPPDEVEALQVRLEAPGSTTATLSWDPVSDAEWYDVYRGTRIDLADLTCFVDHVDGTSVEDDGTVAAGGLYCYLTTAVACDLESTLGEDSSGAPRRDTPPCP